LYIFSKAQRIWAIVGRERTRRSEMCSSNVPKAVMFHAMGFGSTAGDASPQQHTLSSSLLLTFCPCTCATQRTCDFAGRLLVGASTLPTTSSYHSQERQHSALCAALHLQQDVHVLLVQPVLPPLVVRRTALSRRSTRQHIVIQQAAHRFSKVGCWGECLKGR
jgi:hypothetical protein